VGAGAATLGALAGRRVPAGAALGAGSGRARLDHGVGSFDPGPDRVLLWTRVTPQDAAAASMSASWEVVGPDGGVVASGSVEVGPETDWTATVDATGLYPATTYGYRWSLRSGASAEGRTRTLPDRGATPERFRIGVVSCSRFADGGYAAYQALADREVDLVVHLGDYIYEDGVAGARPHDPPERLTTLEAYRARYAQHRTDPALQALHARHPVVAIWDDHEVAGNAWRGGAVGHDDARDGPWPDRLSAAVRAHHEWVPVRLPDLDEPLRIWRGLRIGDLAELSCVDTRIWGRDRQPAEAAALADPGRHLLGDDQERWLLDRLAAGRAGGGARWQVLANQVMLHPLRVPVLGEQVASLVDAAGFLVDGGEALNPDQWDGYPAARARLLDAVGSVGDVVVLTGDVHSSWAWTLPSGPDGSAGAVELVAPAVSSATFADRFPVDPRLVQVGLRAVGPDLAHVELSSHGYVVVELTSDRVHAEWWHVERDDPGTERLDVALQADRAAPMALVPAPDPRPAPDPVPTPTTTVPPVPGAGAEASPPPSGEGGSGGAPVAAVGGAAAMAAVVGALVAVRRRRTT
jgi:alkaline phosphatase D